MISNGPEAISSTDNSVEVITHGGEVIASIAGSKDDVATQILSIIHARLINR